MANNLTDTFTRNAATVVFSTALWAAVQDVDANMATLWTSTTRFFLALALLASLPAFQANIHSALVLSAGVAALYPFFVRLSFIHWIFAAYALIISGGCATAYAACTGASLVMAGVLLPCAFISAICSGGVFAGILLAWLAWQNERWIAY